MMDESTVVIPIDDHGFATETRPLEVRALVHIERERLGGNGARRLIVLRSDDAVSDVG